MILSFHPLFETDTNICCAGRLPNNTDIKAIKRADAVLLPQGCSLNLYSLVKKHCPRVFPNYDARFQFSGKNAQISLFDHTNTPYPESICFSSTRQFYKTYGNPPRSIPFSFPFVFKFDWGGEGDTVFLIQNRIQLETILQKASLFERTGQNGFMLQAFIPCGNRTLRVTVIGSRYISYWRTHPDPNAFGNSLSFGGRIEPDSDLHLQEKGIYLSKHFCSSAKINLAGMDFLFNSSQTPPDPFMIEINYFFGRKGLGGSKKFYGILEKEVKFWIQDHGLPIDHISMLS